MSTQSKPVNERREFIKAVGRGATVAATAGVAGGVVQATTKKTAEPKTRKRKVQFGMLIDLRRCIGCQACTVACKAEADIPLGVTRSWVEYVESGTYPNVKRTFLPRQCQVCSQPECIKLCPTGATYKRPQDGIVVIDQGVCIGCAYCIQACPYSARFLNPVTRFAEKCDLCIHRLYKGVVPACVNTCQGRARIVGDISDPESEISKLIAANPVSQLRLEIGTMPNCYYIGLDMTDENTKKPGQYVRVTTNQPGRHKRG